MVGQSPWQERPGQDAVGQVAVGHPAVPQLPEWQLNNDQKIPPFTWFICASFNRDTVSFFRFNLPSNLIFFM